MNHETGSLSRKARQCDRQHPHLPHTWGEDYGCMGVTHTECQGCNLGWPIEERNGVWWHESPSGSVGWTCRMRSVRAMLNYPEQRQFLRRLDEGEGQVTE